MIFTLKFQGNIFNLMRRAGYHSEGKDEKTGEMAFVRQLGTAGYPRFHIYLKVDEAPPSKHKKNTYSIEGGAIINLHLDQKKPVYRGAPAHGAEYKGKAVEEEAERIKSLCQ